MHIASVSKLITAMATAHVLAKKKLPLDTRIMRFLPRRWSPGPNIDTISFSDLLTNRSGFTTGGSASDYETMKWWVDKGVAATGNYDYENMNFGLCRILIPVVNGDIAEDFVFPPPMDSDKAWDATTIEHYKNYVQQAVFTPAGVSNAAFAPLAPTEALAYAYPAGAGWDSGDLATMSGGAGWRLSVNELLRVMDAFRRKGTIVSPTEAQAFLEAGLGLDSGTPTPVGKVYAKNGRWRNGGRTEQTVAFFLPQNMELVVFVNSPIGVSGESLRGLVKTLYLNNLI